MHWRKIEPARENIDQLLAVICQPAAGAPQSERRAHDHRKPDLGAEIQAVAQVVDQRRAWHVEPDASHGVFEQQAVFGLFDGPKLGPDQLYVVTLQHAAIGQLHRKIQRRLPTHRGQQGESAA